MEIKTFCPIDHKIKALIYGPSGSGKTTFGGTAKNVLFASAENGLLSIADKGVAFTDIKSLSDLEDLRDFLKKGDHNFETLCVDSITEISDTIKRDIEWTTGRSMQIQDWGELGNKIERIIRDIKEIDINVIVIAQEQFDKDSDKIQKIVPSLYGKSATKIAYYMDIVGYLYVDKDGNRKIITASSEKTLSKDRTGRIGNDTDLDFEVWRGLVNEIECGEQKVLYKTQTQAEIMAEEAKKKFDEFQASLKACKTLDELKNAYLPIFRTKSKLGDKIFNELTELKDQLKGEIEEAKKVDELKDEVKKEEEGKKKKSASKEDAEAVFEEENIDVEPETAEEAPKKKTAKK